jgi:hypothetical protein
MARCWGRIEHEWRELERRDEASQVLCRAWDFQSMTVATRTLTVKHWRDTKSGGYPLRNQRDIDLLVANKASRHLRECILNLIPQDVIDDAIAICDAAIAHGDGTPFEDRVKNMVRKFDKVGVTVAMIEDYLQHPLAALVPEQLPRLFEIFKSIKDGVEQREKFFDLNADAKASGPPPADAKGKVKAAAEENEKEEPPGEEKEPLEPSQDELAARKAEIARQQKALLEAENGRSTGMQSAPTGGDEPEPTDEVEGLTEEEAMKQIEGMIAALPKKIREHADFQPFYDHTAERPVAACHHLRGNVAHLRLVKDIAPFIAALNELTRTDIDD